MSQEDPGPNGAPPTIIIPTGAAPLPLGVKWLPREGAEAAGLMRRSKLDDGGRARLLQSSADILGLGVNPATKQGSATGLIVGQVQSGKTMSFTTVVGLARDNGFPIVILIAGNKDSLLTQSHDRLEQDLDVAGGDALPQWKMRKNIRLQDVHDEQLVRQTLENWADPEQEPDEKATLLLTVLKQNQRLDGLKKLLIKFDLSSTPILIIDDEADQASLNTKINCGLESTTYTRIRELRDVLPCHTYLQYTATPQAPLLINIADTLSPDFVRVLQAGDDYVGGDEFFAPRSPFVRVIPQSDILPTGAFPPDPPKSMLDAMRLFFVGLAAARTRRSMLIHPSRIRKDHREVIQWVNSAKDNWRRTLQLVPGDPDREALVQDFKDAYDDLARTAGELPQFPDILSRLPRALRNTTPIEFNTNGRPKAPEIKWRDAEGWILVGGQAVDRGFTVELLTVTYMPRGVGVGNADTLQQRARFFGYKRKYLGLCRIFLEANTRLAYQDYVEHEQIMRSELKRFAETGDNLRTWRRRLILTPNLGPCRRSVISDDYIRARPGGGWSEQRGAEMSPDALAANSSSIQSLMEEYPFLPDSATYASTEKAQQHVVSRQIPLRRVLDLLIDYRLEDAKDTAMFTGILVALGEGLSQDPNATAVVYRMRPNAPGVRRTATDGLLPNGFQQGRTALSGGGTAYPGDRVFRDDVRLTLQLHSYDLTYVSNGPVIVPGAPLIAIYIPPSLARDWLVQIQAGQEPER